MQTLDSHIIFRVARPILSARSCPEPCAGHCRAAVAPDTLRIFGKGLVELPLKLALRYTLRVQSTQRQGMVFEMSVLGIVVLVYWGRHLMLEYLDPQGCALPFGRQGTRHWQR